MTDSSRPWIAIEPSAVADLLRGATIRWWLSGGVALDHWLGRGIRPRQHTDISVVHPDLPALIDSLPDGFDAWVAEERVIADTNDPTEFLDTVFIPLSPDMAEDDLQPVLIRDVARDSWVLKVNIEDGAPRAWVYKRDPRLHVSWDEAVLDVDGIPTGAPEIQLIWKTLRPRPGDEEDKDAVLPHLSEEAHTRYERGILAIHPHSSWAIHVRTPLTPAKASWNRSRAIRTD